LARQLKVSENMIVTSMRHRGDTHTLVANYYWRASRAHNSLGGEPPLADFQMLREAVVVIKSNYLHLLSDRDHLLMLREMYQDALKVKEEEVDRLTQELAITHDSLKSMQRALQELGMQVEHLCVDLSGVHPSSPTSNCQSCMTAISRDDVSGIYYLMEEPHVMVGHEEHVGLQVFTDRYDPKISDFLYYGDQEPLLLESPLKAQVMITNGTVEHIPCGSDNREVYASRDCGERYITDEDISIWDPGLV
jgi:hypothetical protein